MFIVIQFSIHLLSTYSSWWILTFCVGIYLLFTHTTFSPVRCESLIINITSELYIDNKCCYSYQWHVSNISWKTFNWEINWTTVQDIDIFFFIDRSIIRIIIAILNNRSRTSFGFYVIRFPIACSNHWASVQYSSGSNTLILSILRSTTYLKCRIQSISLTINISRYDILSKRRLNTLFELLKAKRTK